MPLAVRRPRPLVLASMVVAFLAAIVFGMTTERAGAAMPPASPLSQVFSGNVISKIGPNNPGIARPVSVSVKSTPGIANTGGFNGHVTEVIVTSTAGTPSEGDVRVNTTTSGWQRQVAVKSKFQLLTPSTAAAQVYTKGAWRPLKRDPQKDSVLAYFVADGGRLYVSINGLVHNGTTNVAVEIVSGTSNEAAFGYGNVSALDAAPIAVSSSPANGSVAPTNVTPSFTISENVTANIAAATLVCNSTPVPFTLVGSGTKVLGLDPVSDLPAGASCTATLNMAQVSDADSIDPPNTGTGVESFSFTVDTPPSVVSVLPDGIIPASANIVVTFSESVLMSTQSFQVTCGEGQTPVAYLLTSNPARTVATLNPLVDLPEGETCQVVVVANKVTDIDTADPIDAMLSNYTHTFSIDAAPFVESMVLSSNQSGMVETGPIFHFELGQNAPTNGTIYVQFSEMITGHGNPGVITVQCNGQNQALTITPGATQALIAPATSWPVGSFCSGTILATGISDTDAIDPPDNMNQNVTFAFSIDAPPAVVTGVSNGNPPVVTVTFNEPVIVSLASMVCNSVPLVTGGSTNITSTAWTFDYTSYSEQFESSQSCVFTIAAVNVHDLDLADPPNNLLSDYVLNIVTDEPPIVTSVTMTPNGDQCLGAVIDGPQGNSLCASLASVTSTTPTFTVNFSEPVNVSSTGAAYSLSCVPSGGSLSGGTGTNMTQATVTASGITPGADCTFTVLAAGVADSDLADPPNNPLANYPFEFEVDEAPSVSSVVPANNATISSDSDTFEVTFSEPVSAGTTTSATLVCDSENVPVVVTNLGLTASVAYPSLVDYEGDSCTLTIVAAEVTDLDFLDAPDTMAANAVFTYTVDARPSLLTFSPTGSTVGTGQVFTLTFSESVVIDGADVSVTCGDSDTVQTFSFAPSTPSSSFTITPSPSWMEGADCTVAIAATDIADEDAVDEPNNPNAAVSQDFTTDAAPAVTAIETVDESDTTQVLSDGGNVPTGHDVRVTFDESVSGDAGWLTVTCDSPLHSFSALAAGPGTSLETTPTSIPVGASGCVLTVHASLIHDTDSADAPDVLAADVARTLVSDVAPTVLSVTPTSTSVIGDNFGGSDTFEVVFSEAVALGLNAVELSCGTPGASVVSTGASSLDNVTWTITYASLLSFQGQPCTLKLTAAEVTDVDLADGPDAMESDFTATYTVDAPPAVSSTDPVNAATVPATQILRVNFDEPVTLGSSAISVSCNAVPQLLGPITAVVGLNNASYDVIPPIVGWPEGTTCSVHVEADDVTDEDTADSPDWMLVDYDFAFDVDSAPEVVSFSRVYPGNSDTIETNDTVGSMDFIAVTFSESVTGESGWLSISCVGGFFALSEEETVASTTLEYDPAGLPEGDSCTLTVVGSLVHDADLNDNPDVVVGSPSITVTVDAPPAFSSSVPADEATDVSASLAQISVTFDEAVTITTDSGITLVCTTSGSHAISVDTAVGSTVVFGITGALDPSEDCTFTIPAANVSDNDVFDVPNLPTANIVITFTVSAAVAPVFDSHSPTTANPSDPATVNLLFDVAVNYVGGSVTLTCEAGTATLAYASGNGTTTLTFSDAVPVFGVDLWGECTATFLAIDIESVAGGLNPAADITVTIQGPIMT